MSRYLNELDARELLSTYDIPMAKSFCCKSVEDLSAIAEKLSYPIVMKILSSDILHKTEAKCVFIGIKDIAQASEAFSAIMNNARAYMPEAVIDGILVQEMAEKGLELIIGFKRDPQFGPVIMAGSGGIYVEVFKDVALRLIPITRYDAESLLMETKAAQIINGARGTMYDKEALIDVLLKVSDMIEQNDSIEEIDINPFFLYGEGKGGKGVDALIKMR
jgi:succinyl-CoA synthetase beta subunit